MWEDFHFLFFWSLGYQYWNSEWSFDLVTNFYLDIFWQGVRLYIRILNYHNRRQAVAAATFEVKSEGRIRSAFTSCFEGVMWKPRGSAQGEVQRDGSFENAQTAYLNRQTDILVAAVTRCRISSTSISIFKITRTGKEISWMGQILILLISLIFFTGL